MILQNLVFGIAGSIIATIIIVIVTKIYIGVSNFRGLMGSIRIIRDCYEGGIVNIFPSRKAYVHHKDHGTESQYISKCSNQLMYVGYWLAHGTEMGDIIKTLRQLLIDGKGVEVVLLNPNNAILLKEIADYMGIDCEEMKQRINVSLSKLIKMKCELDQETGAFFQIKIHDIPLNSSAFLVDYDNRKTIRILIDYKTYGHEREKSYGIEYRDNDKIITKTLRDSYLKISKTAKVYENR